jgi:hypothetical protein
MKGRRRGKSCFVKGGEKAVEKENEKGNGGKREK